MNTEPDYIIDGALAIVNAGYERHKIGKKAFLKALEFPRANRAGEALQQAKAAAQEHWDAFIRSWVEE